MPRRPYAGTSRKLLLAFDVGTTFSGISYSILDPGQIPEIRPVTRYPGQGHVGADCKIPTEIYYDSEGEVQAAGAEARQSNIEDIAEDVGWTKAKWFKLHMRPRGQRSNILAPAIPPLPPNKTVVMVFADYLKYLHNCAKVYIQETHAGGASIWNTVAKDITYVLTHPNGWEGPQQAQMREAAIAANLIPDTAEGRARITFVTEGEASLHFCINNNLAPDALKNGEGIIIVDAGGGTVDVSAYRGDGAAFQETAIPQCHFQGSVYVTGRAEAYINGLLKDSDFEDYVPHIVDQFDGGAKLTFKDESLPQYIRFGHPRETKLSLGIKNGQLRIAGAALATFFEPSVSCIVQAVRDQVASSQHTITHVFLVGGFSASDWLYNEVKRALQPEGLEISRPDRHVNKAVSDGSAAFAIDHYVETRMSRAFFGTCTMVKYNPAEPEHLRRHSKVFAHSATLEEYIDGLFHAILRKNEQVSEVKEYRQSFVRYYRGFQEIETTNFKAHIRSYSGNSNDPQWMDVEPDNYATACTVYANIQDLPRTPTIGSGLRFYYIVRFDVILLFGLTELKAQIAWKDLNGVEKRGPASVLYEPN
ncbi:hypothetical protein BKA70DRAFT_1560798 [Coprinopsis sp. MPI-PUGE-AT-0042]|nr:hypothetical protein BKA70DRAFT_1560798 [Coprinopsis sp. MPI-PUGE-AT-0042]